MTSPDLERAAAVADRVRERYEARAAGARRNRIDAPWLHEGACVAEDIAARIRALPSSEWRAALPTDRERARHDEAHGGWIMERGCRVRVAVWLYRSPAMPAMTLLVRPGVTLSRAGEYRPATLDATPVPWPETREKP